MGMTILKYLMIGAASFFLFFTIFYLTDKTFERRVRLPWIILLLAAATVVHIAFTAVLALQAYRAFLTFGFPILFPLVLYRGGSPGRRAGLGVLMIIFFICIDLVQGVLYLLIFADGITMDFSYQRQAFYLVTLAIVSCFFPKIQRGMVAVLNKFRFSPYQIFMMATIFVFQTMVSNYIGIQIGALGAQRFSVFFMLLLFQVVMDCLMLYLLRKMDRTSRLAQQQALMRQQDEMKRAYYRMLELYYQDSRTLLHDIKNHIAAIEGFYEAGERETAEAYVDKVMANMKETAKTMGAHRKRSERALQGIGHTEKQQG
ncbi:MAG: hypothetical protein Q4C55_06515 [Eubacterium sp.]|nr:hypothetical protein [Eubacterium sp.]